MINNEEANNIQPAGRAVQNKTKPLGFVMCAVKIIGNIIFAFFLILICVMVFFLVQSRMTGDVPSVAGYRMYIVFSNSMTPTFDVGSMVIVRPLEPDLLAVGDIITFKAPEGSNKNITHRITAVHNTAEGLYFTTRGDANNIDDPVPVPAQNVIGKVTAAVPYAGYLFNWSRTKKGVLVLIIIPGILCIASELRNLFRYAAEIEKEKNNENKTEAEK